MEGSICFLYNTKRYSLYTTGRTSSSTRRPDVQENDLFFVTSESAAAVSDQNSCASFYLASPFLEHLFFLPITSRRSEARVAEVTESLVPKGKVGLVAKGPRGSGSLFLGGLKGVWMGWRRWLDGYPVLPN